jgi:serine/threonine-protein kinase PknK
VVIPPSPKTKFRPPVGSGRLLDRKRLIDALQEGRHRQLTLIHAPAGFGKTTLASQWRDRLQAEGQAVAWVSIDRDDDNPVWLVAHLIETIQAVRPDLTEELPMLLERHVDDAHRYVLPALINEIDASGEPLMIVVDDWYQVSDPRAIAVMEFLLDRITPLLQFVITSRSRSGLPLGRLRMRDQVTEIDEFMSRFDAAESERLLVGVDGLPLSDADIATLMRTTDGWVAALRLVALSMRGAANIPQLVAELSGRHHAIEAYLAENVLNRLPPRILEFLLRTAVPQQICAGLATDLTGETHGQALLEQVETDDLFLHPLDADRIWFSYHHLFADLLHARLQRDHPGEVAELHRRAARWYARNDLPTEAVDHALAVGERQLAVDIVVDHAMPLFEESKLIVVLALLDKLPSGLVVTEPQLQIASGWANLLLQRQVQAEQSVRQLRLLMSGSGPDASDVRFPEAELLQGNLLIYRDRMDGVQPLIAECLDRADSLRPWLVGAAADTESVFNLRRFDFTAVRRRQEWAWPFHQRSAGPFTLIYGQLLVGLAALEELDVRAAEKYLELAARSGGWASGSKSYIQQVAASQLAALHYQLGDLEMAEQGFVDRADLGEGGMVEDLMPLHLLPARIKAARGDRARAQDHLARGARVARDLGLDRLLAAVIEEQARLDLPETETPPQVPEFTGRPQDCISIVMADSLDAAKLHRGLHTRSTAIARALLPVARDLFTRTEARARPLAALRTRILLAATLHRADRTQEARDCLAPALRICARTGLVAPMSDAGPAIAELLGTIITTTRTTGRTPLLDGVPDAVLFRLQQAAPGSDPTTDTVVAREARRDRHVLSEREQQILELLDAGRSNQQIARTLNLSTNTVKWHLKAMYAKFDVTRRQECVAAARKEHLLPAPGAAPTD